MGKNIMIKGKSYEIGNSKELGYEKDKAYFIKNTKFPNGKYFIYRGKIKDLESFSNKELEGIYYIEENGKYKIKLLDDTAFYDMSISQITKKMKTVKKRSSEPIEGSNGFISPDTTVFKPEIKEADGELTRIIKGILHDEDWTSAQLSEKVSNSIELSNLKRSLTVHNNLSFDRFARWLNILGKEYEIIIR